MKTTATTAAMALATILAVAPAAAEADDAAQMISASTDENPGSGALTVRAPVLIGLGEAAAGAPVSVGLDAWYGVNEKLSVGVVHSPYGISGFYGSARGGFCITGEDNGCPDIYDNVGLDVRYRVLSTDRLGVEAVYTGLAQSLDPFAFTTRWGIAARYAATDQLAVDFQPNLFIGVTERDAGNKELVNLPLTLHVSPIPELGLLLQTGVAMPLEDAGDNYAIPMSVGASVALTNELSAAAVFSLPQAIAGDVLTNDGAIDGTDVRTATISLQFVR